MVFVTVGTATQPFRRLLDEVARLADSGEFGTEPVVVQHGYSPFASETAEAHEFLSRDAFEQKLESCSIIVTHGGSTVLEAVRVGRVPVAMPRLARFGEHVNDHQLEFVRALADEGWVVPAWEPADLMNAVRAARITPPRTPPRSPMLQLVAAAIHEMFPGLEK